MSIIQTEFIIPKMTKDILESMIYTSLVNAKGDGKTEIIKTSKNNIKAMLPETYIIDNLKYIIKSSLDNQERDIYIKRKIYEGSFNKIYNISRIKSDNIDNNVLIRILNSNTDDDTIKNEINGIKLQYKLCSKCDNIGIVVDYGKITSTPVPQDYVILAKYGISLTKLLNSNIKYSNMGVPIRFMHDLLKSINSIHRQNYAHLDLKPCNIILKNINTIPKNEINKLDFSIIDFGGSKKFNNNSSTTIDEQMASAAFSPPELLKMQFGKKSDIWAYGIICYLVCIRQFFLKANAAQIFMSNNNDILYEQLERGLNELNTKIIPSSLKNEDAIMNYLYPITDDTIDIFTDFFKKIFVIDINKRPDTHELLSHDLFKLI